MNISRYRCRICYNYAIRSGVSINHLPKIAQNIGTLLSSYKRNQKEIKKHTEIPSHLNAVNYIAKNLIDSQRSAAASNKKIEKNKNELLIMTARIMRTVFTNIIGGGTYQNIIRLINLQKMNRLNMGSHHNNKNSAMRMTRVISNTMLKNFIDKMREKPIPITILEDTAEDRSQTHHSIVYLVYVSDSIQKVVFYKFIKLGKSLDSDALFSALLEI